MKIEEKFEKTMEEVKETIETLKNTDTSEEGATELLEAGKGQLASLRDRIEQDTGEIKNV